MHLVAEDVSLPLNALTCFHMFVFGRVTFRKLASLFVSLALLGLFGPAIGKHCLHAFTPASTLIAWQAEVDRLDHVIPREPSNEAKRLELLRKLRQCGMRLDEGIIEEIDQHFTPYTIAVRIGWSWQELFAMR